MSALVLDAGAFIAVDRDDRAMMARLRVAQLHGYDLRTCAIVIARVWRSPAGKQARLAALLRAVDVHSVDERIGREAGVLQAKAGTDDPIDATVVLIARPGDCILTGDVEDIEHLAASCGKRVHVIRC